MKFHLKNTNFQVTVIFLLMKQTDFEEQIFYRTFAYQ